ncbi:hypothetical protein CK203_097389 [Vitis vinifera]|uniref:Uncharacterized protein n=1 Tax=Vitis vinifera TaxID=29760 RepID=A0A438D9A0_VITVI|nr:hypothetical protein CK203_097389 [Vitis vinifera]
MMSFNSIENNKERRVGVTMLMVAKHRKEIEACFGCGKYEYMIWDCPWNKKFITRKPKKVNMEDKRKPSAQGWVFAMNHRDA